MRLLSASAFLLCCASSLAQAAGNVNVYIAGDSKPKILTNAARLIDVVGQPRLAQSWWPGAVISERQATALEEQRQQALLGRLSALAAEEEGDEAAAINSLRRQVQA